jgi:hypothetical protein
VTSRRGRSRKQVLDDLKKRSESWKLKEEALDLTLWKRLWTCLMTEYVANGGRKGKGGGGVSISGRQMGTFCCAFYHYRS